MLNLYPWQEDSWQNLQGLRSHLPHALLFKGEQGIGKFDLAMLFSQSLLCSSQVEHGFACQKCDSCRWFNQGTHPDFRLIQSEDLSQTEESIESNKKPSKEISVAQIRELADFANLSAHQGGYRVVLVHPAESMNTNSANALLKTLEEPSENLLFILVTHKPQQLLPTILSRCLSFNIRTPSQKFSLAWLKQQGVSQPEHALAQSGFSPLIALQRSENGEVSATNRAILLAGIRQPQQLDSMALADQLQRAAPVQVIHCMQQWCYDLASYKLAGAIRYHPEQTDLIENLSKNMALPGLLRYVKELQVAKREAFHPLNPKLLFESILLAYQQLLIPSNKA